MSYQEPHGLVWRGSCLRCCPDGGAIFDRDREGGYVCRCCGHTRIDALNPQAMAALRALRVWHWKEAQRWRLTQQHAKGDIAPVLAETRGNDHVKMVQALNSLFPAGDTAEQDAKR